MQLTQLHEQTWVIQGGANIGVIAHEGRCLIIDSGMDKDAGRDILNQVKKLGLTPTALLVTHAHADHFGGAHYLVRQTGLKVYATRVEAAVMSGPILEPLYLFSGAQPPPELQHKFLLAKPCPVDIVLSGNEQLVVTLTTLKTQILPFKHIVAGHGEIYTSIEQTNRAIEYTIERLESILENIRAALTDGKARPAADILSAVAQAQGAHIQAFPQYVLYNTTVQSALSTLYRRGEISPIFQDNSLTWRRA